MSFPDKVKNAVQDRLIESAFAAITVLLAWLLSIIGPGIWESISASVPARAIFPVLLLSILTNIVLGALIYRAYRRPEFELRYGIYWDSGRNPHCPVCKKPVYYDTWHMHGTGYFCKPCNKVTPLKDAHGKEVQPADVFKSTSNN